MTDEIKARPQALLNGILLIGMEPGELVFDMHGKMLGRVQPGVPVIVDKSCYLTLDEYNAAKLFALSNGARTHFN